MRLLHRLAAALAGIAFAVSAASAVLAAPPLWAVSDEDSTLYLFGTMHLLSADATWRTPAFDRALAESADVWLEMDVGADPEEMAALLLKYGVDMQTPLADRVSPRTMAAVREALKAQPQIARLAEHMRPWAAGMFVQLAPLIKAGLKAGAGAETELSRDARAAGKRMRYFETGEQQLRFFADLPEPVQLQFLEDSLEGADMSGEEVLKLQAAWINGDLNTLGALIVEGMRKDYPELYDALIRRRNHAWAAALTQEMAGAGTQIVNVGALHMVGDDGLVELLQSRGFTVERVQ